MQGVAGGWLAVGFSFTASMFDADVVGCIRDPNTDDVTAIDTWNVLSPTRNNMRDITQDIVLFNSSFVNSTISCTFSRLITGSDPAPQDRNLDNDYFILYGYRGANNPANDIMRFPIHDVTPVSSSVMFNPVNGNNQPFNNVTIPVRDPEDYRLTFRTPAGCTVTSCTSFIGIDTNTGNPGILDIYMEGEAQGWVAVGFTATRNMFDADVVACNRDPGTNMIEALDTYNLPGPPPPPRNNLVDDRQNVQLFSSSFDGSRIICTVGKEITARDPVPQDINLNSANLYVLWGVRVDDSQPGMLITHGANVPAASLEQVDPTRDIGGLDIPVRAPEDYRLTFRSPPNCLLNECNVFVGIDTNSGSSEYLDITMQGVAGGWLAVGFSLTANMFDADVVGCIRDPNTNDVTALDTWNPLSPTRTNTRDDTQDIVLFSSSFVNSRISCTFSRLITGNDPAPQDRNLDNDYFILYGYRGADNPANDIMRFPIHDVTPVSSSVMFNPVNGNNQPFNNVAIPVRDPEDYRLTFRTPAGCNVTNCTSFVGIDTNTGNPGILDIYMEGEAQGWVAVGFTATRNMFDADVVACNRDPGTNMIEALDTYNLPGPPPPPRNNMVDDRQNVLLFNGSFDGSRIICTVGKEIAPSDPVPQDINLNSADLYVLWGVRVDDSQPGMLLTHGADVPAASLEQVNPAGLGLDDMLDTPTRLPVEYRLRIRNPPECDPSACDLYVGIDTNTGDPGFLDIYMEGDAEGWVAVGFSETRDMFAADVVGCNRDPNTNIIAAVDTWNLNQGRGNTLDATQDVSLFLGNFMDGRITCTFAKRIAATDTDPQQDLNLTSALFVMYGVGPTGTGAQALASHVQGAGGNPLLSENRVNAVEDSGDLGDDFPIGQLLRAHGILMLIAWPLLAVSGIFFAAWMRPALPNGEWFQIHRAFLLSSLFVGAIGFMMAFIAHARNPTPGLINFSGNPTGTAHYAIGLIVMLLHIINPIISACRCHPGGKYRWVFNLIHGTTIGLLVEILALTNIALGLERFGSSSFFAQSNRLTIFWVYIGFLIFFLVMIGVLFLVFTLLSLFSQDEDRSKTAPSLIKPLIGSGPDSMHKPVPTNEGVELAVPGQKPTVASGDDSEKPKVPSKDAPLRWGALTIFLVVNVIMMLVLVILIAIE